MKREDGEKVSKGTEREREIEKRGLMRHQPFKNFTEKQKHFL